MKSYFNLFTHFEYFLFLLIAWNIGTLLNFSWETFNINHENYDERYFYLIWPALLYFIGLIIMIIKMKLRHKAWVDFKKQNPMWPGGLV